jgi:hypothetical protein
MDAGLRVKTPNLHGIYQLNIFQVEHLDIAVTEEKQMNQFVGDIQMS